MANQKHGFGVLMKKFNGHFVFIFEGQWINNRFVSMYVSKEFLSCRSNSSFTWNLQCKEDVQVTGFFNLPHGSYTITIQNLRLLTL